MLFISLESRVYPTSEGDDMNLVQDGDSKARRDQGMTILETMISVLILALFMLGVAALITQSSKLADMGRDHYMAVNLCRNRLENANVFTYNSGFDSLTSLRETNFVCSDTGAADPDGRPAHAKVPRAFAILR